MYPSNEVVISRNICERVIEMRSAYWIYIHVTLAHLVEVEYNSNALFFKLLGLGLKIMQTLSQIGQ